MEEHTLEQGFDKLEDIISKMEGTDVSLDDSFALYKQGMEELQYCKSRIDETKKAVMAINESGQLEVFEEEE